MIYFNDLPLDKEILDALGELSIEYVFQSIFYPDGKSIFAREALMRPEKMSVMELIDKYTKEGKLHILEVATIFGAMQEYLLRGYTENLCLNSFPTESFSEKEFKAFKDYYGESDTKAAIILEILEYPMFSEKVAEYKREFCKVAATPLSIDDFGSGINDMKVVDFYDPALVKIDRALLMDVDKDIEKQEKIKDIIKELHSKNAYVVAEGVETRGEYDFLLSAGADFFQGYYFHRPE